MSFRQTLVEMFLKHRGRLARVVAIAGVLVVASTLMPIFPREVELRYDLGPMHASVTGLELVYQQGDLDVASARFGFGEEGPRLVPHQLRLAPGRYEVRATVETPAGGLRYLRQFEVPAGHEVRLELFDVALARVGSPGR